MNSSKSNMTRKHRSSSSESASYYPATVSKPKYPNRIPKQNALEEEEDDDNSNYSDADAVDFEYNNESKEEDDHQQFEYEIEKYEEDNDDDDDGDDDEIPFLNLIHCLVIHLF